LTSAPDWPTLEAILARDPGGRGVASYRRQDHLLASGQLEAAARSLADGGQHVAIVTGFCVAGGATLVAETDGPPGALYLARALTALGCDVTLISDWIALPLLALGCSHWNLERVALREFPFASTGHVEAWINDFLEPPHSTSTRERSDSHFDDRSSHEFRDPLQSPRPFRPLTHLLAIERAGPSHTLASLVAQPRVGAAPAELFEREVPQEHRDHCHNMRGELIDAWTAPAHRIFEAVGARALPIETIGLADGGNEIGAGAIAWEILREAISQGPAGRVACRTSTDHLLLAGVSNWAAYALAVSVAALCGRRDLVALWDTGSQRLLIETLVHEGGAVDGLTRLRQPTVDGLPLDSYLATLGEICQVINPLPSNVIPLSSL
jgi:D-glutamate cyclase